MLAGASLLGIGSLAYYGLGLSNQSGIVDRSAVWPQFIRDRVSTTYEYFGAALGYDVWTKLHFYDENLKNLFYLRVTAASAFAISRNPTLMNLASRNSILRCLEFLLNFIDWEQF